METFSVLKIVAPPLGLAYLAAVAEQEGHEVRIFDAPALQASYEQLDGEVDRFKPDLVGVTSTTATLKEAAEICKSIHQGHPEVVTVMGGPHVSFMPRQTLSENPSINIVCIGEGEKTFIELLRSIENGWGLERVKGIAYRRDGEVIMNPPNDPILDLDSLPFPARHLLPVDRYGGLGRKIFPGSIVSSRGCPFSCTFCSSSQLFGKRFRMRSAGNVVDEIEQLKDKYHTRFIEFLDDTFTLNKRRVEEICDEIQRRGLDIWWICSSRVDTITRDLMRKMKRSGCGMIYFGVESGVQSIINVVKKGIRLEQATAAIRLAKEIGIETLVSFIIGVPGETEREVRQTIRFAKKLDPEYVQFSIATPYPGTELYREAIRQGLLKFKDWSDFTVLKPIMGTIDLSKIQLEKLLAAAYLEFYLRPKALVRCIRRGMLQKLVMTIPSYFLKSVRSYLWR